MTSKHLALAFALLLAACGKPAAGPWNTSPGIVGHGAMFLLAGTPHDPTGPGISINSPPVKGCTDCHVNPDTFATFDCIHCHGKAQTDGIHLGKVTGYPAAPVSLDCYGCHRNGLGISPVDHAPFFPIGTASHPAVCTSCHANPAQRTNLATLQCAACHAGRPAFPAKHTAVADYPAAPAAADCLACHGDGQVDRLAAHQARFPIAAGSASHGTGCLHCHTRQRADKTYAVDFRGAYDCLACHLNGGAAGNILTTTDAQHGGVTGYVYASASCYGCHPDGTGAPANHNPSFFPIGAGSKHAGVSCIQCHTDPAHRQDVTKLGCATAACHAGVPGFSGGHAPVGGVSLLAVHTSQSASSQLPLTAPNCLRCHADSQVNTVASHQGGDRGLGKSNHKAAGCLTCHSAFRTDKPFGASFSSTPGCAICHPNGIPN